MPEAVQPSPRPVAVVRVALLTNFIAPYRISLLEAIAARVGELRIFVSTLMEPDRNWTPQHGRLDVVVQRTWTLKAMHRRPSGVQQQLHIHLPLDTLPLLWRHRPDLVISGEMGARSLQAALYRRMRPASRLIVWATLSEHTEKDWGWARRGLRRLILKSADAVIVNGQSGERYVTGLRPSIRTIVVNQPVPTQELSALPLARTSAQTRRLLFCGRLIELKGVFELQQAIAARAASHPGEAIELVWAGEGTARSTLEQTSMPPNVRQRFTGPLAYDEMPPLYAECGVLILPTLLDEWGLVVNEALACGLPVLGSIFSQAVEELIEDGVTGWLFDPTDPASFARALAAFFDASPQHLATMRQAARRRGQMVTVTGAAERIVQAAASLLPNRAA